MRKKLEAQRANGSSFDNVTDRVSAILRRATHALNAGDLGPATARFAAVLALDPDNLEGLLGYAEGTLAGFEWATSRGRSLNDDTKRSAAEALNEALAGISRATQRAPTDSRTSTIGAKLQRALSTL